MDPLSFKVCFFHLLNDFDQNSTLFDCDTCSLYLFVCLFVYFWLHWVFFAVCQLSLVAAGGGYSPLWCVGFSLWWLLLSQSTGSRHVDFSSCHTLWHVGSVVVAHGLSCSAACGIFTDQGSNPCPLHWQADVSSFFFFLTSLLEYNCFTVVC